MRNTRERRRVSSYRNTIENRWRIVDRSERAESTVLFDHWQIRKWTDRFHSQRFSYRNVRVAMSLKPHRRLLLRSTIALPSCTAIWTIVWFEHWSFVNEFRRKSRSGRSVVPFNRLSTSRLSQMPRKRLNDEQRSEKNKSKMTRFTRRDTSARGPDTRHRFQFDE